MIRGATKSTEPANASSNGEQDDRPLSHSQAVAIWVNQLNQGVFITLPFTLAAYMVRHFAATSEAQTVVSESAIGRQTGLLAATASAAQCMTSFAWGFISDRTGRKPVVLVGNLSAGGSILALGLSTSYPAALAFRFVGGLLTSSTGVAIKTIIAESCNANNQAKAIGVLTFGWGMGTVLGPILGGSLAEPCRSFSSMPLCGAGQLFEARPFLLPCLVSACLALLACCTNACMMAETHPGLLAARYSRLAGDEEDSMPQLELAAHKPQQQWQQPAALEEAAGSPGERKARPGAAQPCAAAEEHASTQQHSPEGSDPAPELDRHQEGRGPGPAKAAAGSAHAEQRQHCDVAADSAAPAKAAHACSGPAEDTRPGKAHSGDSASSLDAWQHAQPGAGPTSPAAAGAVQGSAPVVARSRGPVRQSVDARAASSELVLSMDLAETGGAGVAAALDRQGSSCSAWEQQLGVSQTPGAALQGSAGPHDPRSAAGAAVPAQDEAEVTPPRPWYRDKPLLTSLAGSGLIVLVFNLLAELAPLLASAPHSSGGLGLSEQQLSVPLTCSGAALMAYSLFVFPRVTRRWGQLACCRMGLLAGVPGCLLTPAATLLRAVPPGPQLCLAASLAAQNVAKIMALGSSSVLINLAALALPCAVGKGGGPVSQVGTVNGASQTLAALSRALGPAIGGWLWGLAAAADGALAAWLPFVVCAGGMLLTAFLYALFVRMPRT